MRQIGGRPNQANAFAATTNVRIRRERGSRSITSLLDSRPDRFNLLLIVLHLEGRVADLTNGELFRLGAAVGWVLGRQNETVFSHLPRTTFVDRDLLVPLFELPLQGVGAVLDECGFKLARDLGRVHLADPLSREQLGDLGFAGLLLLPGG